MATMEFESEGRAILSPGARVVVGSPWVGVASALLAGIVIGMAIATITARARRHSRRQGHLLERLDSPGFRLPGESPDVETEL